MSYHGDETYSLVGEIGTLYTKFGYSGQDCPNNVFSSMVGHVQGKSQRGDGDAMEVDRSVVVGDANIGFRRTDLDLKSPLENGSIVHWDVVESLWRYAFGAMRAEVSGSPFISAVPSWASAADMEKMLELAFEKFDLGAVYLGRNAMFSAFSTGRSTALVCDCGAGSTSAVPVVDGYVLTRATRRSAKGGNWLDAQVLRYLDQHKISVKPQKGVVWGEKASAVPASYVRFQRMAIVRDLKQACCMVPQPPSSDGEMSDIDSEAEGSDAETLKEYELPDGTKIQTEPGLANIPEPLFAVMSTESESSAAAQSSSPRQPKDDNLPRLAYGSVEGSDVDVRKELLQNILLTGGGSMFRGASERLQHEVSEMVPSAYKVKVVTAVPIERRFSVWLGASILASLGSFQQLWLSRKEYMEFGAARAVQDRFH